MRRGTHQHTTCSLEVFFFLAENNHPSSGYRQTEMVSQPLGGFFLTHHGSAPGAGSCAEPLSHSTLPHTCCFFYATGCLGLSYLRSPCHPGWAAGVPSPAVSCQHSQCMLEKSRAATLGLSHCTPKTFLHGYSTTHAWLPLLGGTPESPRVTAPCPAAVHGQGLRHPHCRDSEPSCSHLWDLIQHPKTPEKS